MRDKLEQLLAKAKEVNDKLSRRNKILLIACIAAIIIIAFIGALLLNANSSTPLFVNLTQNEATEILGKLQDMGVNGSYSNGTISVPTSQADTLRAQLVLQGYPKQGLSYDVFKNNIDMMSTDLDRETYKLFDLQDRIAGTIRHFDGVEDAVVNLYMGNTGNYVLTRDKQEPSAAVTVFMKNGGSPSSEQVSGIQRLVASSMPGMSTENVAVIDGRGNDVSEVSADVESGTARLKMALESEIERRIQLKVLNLLYSIYGQDRVVVSANCVVDVNKKLREIIEYSPSKDDNNTGVLYHEQTGAEAVGSGSVTYGVPGTETNAQIPIYPNITSDGNDIYYTDDRSFDYFVSKMTEQITDEGGDLLDVSVAVAIDDEKLTRTEKEDLRQLVAQAAGIAIENADAKVTIVNAAFAGNTTSGPVGGIIQFIKASPNLMWILIGAAGLLLLLIVLLVLLLRRAAKKKQQKKLEQEEEERLLAAAAAATMTEEDTEEDILMTPLDQAKKTREQELKLQIGEFADLNPEIVAQLIKTWLKGGPGNE